MEDSLLSGLSSLRRNAPQGLAWPAAEFDPDHAGRLLDYLGELKRWNKAYNLTAIDEPDQMVIRHLLDSLSIAPWVQGRVLDVGTGAGLPGIPLAIMDTELDMTLMDRTAKKIRFLDHVIRKLQLVNVEAVHSRIEEHSSLAPYDVIVSRAFSSLADFAHTSRHLLGPRSRLLAMKGKRPDSELKVLPEWIGVDAVEKLPVPGLHEDRHLVIMSLP